MAINAEIPLQVRPAPDPLQQYGKALAIRNEMAQGPLRAEQLRGAQLENQTRQRSLDQTDALNQAYSNALSVGPDGKPSIDTGGLTKALATNGHGSAIPGILKGVADSQESIAKLAKTRGEVRGQEGDAAGAIGSAILDAKGDPRLFLTLTQHAIDAGSVDPGVMKPLIDHVQQGLQADPTGAAITPDVLKFGQQFVAMSPKHSELRTARLREESAAEKNTVETGNLKQTGETKERQDAAAILGAATTQQEYAQKFGELKARVATQFPLPATFNPATTPAQIRALGMSSEQQQTAAQAKITEAETSRHNLTTESTAALNQAVNQGRLAQTQTVNGLKYGPGTQEYWVKQLQDNPDSIKEMPAELRTTVGQKFREATGLPLPTPLTGAAQTSETAARNSLDGIAFINKALDNPEIRKQIGPIMGRLGNAEQAIGTAVGLSPEAAQLAQELRTRMRYFVFQEGKAVLGGRLPQNLMKALEESSANPKMDANLLHGALNGAEGSAQSILDNADKQRFGGKMRPRSMRGAENAPNLPQGGGKAIDKETAMRFYQAAGGDPATRAERSRKLATDNGWKLE